MGRQMTGPTRQVETAELEAAAWHARLGAPEVDGTTIKEFFAWRAAPANAEAYRRVESVWKQSGTLQASPAIQAVLDEAMSQGSARSRRGRGRVWAFGGLSAIGAALALGGFAWWWTDARTLYATGVGEQRLVQLADGSSVRIDTDSRLRVRFSGDERRIELIRGQALFDVAPDAARPFVVAADGARVVAVGTVFDVRRDAAGLRVTLVEGVVDVAGPAGQSRRMSAGRQARIDAAGVSTREVDARSETSWTEGRIVFVDAPLDQAVAEVNRYLTRPVRLASGGEAAVRVNGSFRIGDRDAFVAAASGALGLRATPEADGAVTLSTP